MIASWGVLALVGCAIDAWPSDDGHYMLSDTDLVVSATGVYQGGPLLVGSHTCPELTCAGDHCPASDNDVGQDLWREEAEDCLVWTASGAGELVERCLWVTEPGSAVLHLDPDRCGGRYVDTYVDDSSTLEVVGPEGLEAIFQANMEAVAEVLWAFSGAEGAAWPEGWKLSDHEVPRIVADAPFGVETGLYDPVTDRIIGWHLDDSALSLASPGGDGLDAQRVGETQLSFSLPPGRRVQVDLEVAGTRWRVGEVQGVAREELVNLELAVLYQARQAGAAGLAPLGVRAIAHNADGDVVFGPPVTWQLQEDDLVMMSFDELTDEPYQDYAYLADACRRPSESVGEQTATVRAQLDGLEASLTFSWDGHYPDQAALQADLDAGLDPDAGWRHSSDCPNYAPEPIPGDDDDDAPGRLCGCAMAPWSGQLMGAFVLLAGWRRRDSRVADSARASGFYS